MSLFQKLKTSERSSVPLTDPNQETESRKLDYTAGECLASCSTSSENDPEWEVGKNNATVEDLVPPQGGHRIP